MERDELLISDDFGKMLKKLRKSKGYTLEQVASKAGLSASYLHRLEKGERKAPSFMMIIKLAEIFAVEPFTLAGLEHNSSERPISISELFFNHTVEHNDEILNASKKSLLVEIAETALLLKWEKSTIVNDLQQIAELISELKEL